MQKVSLYQYKNTAFITKPKKAVSFGNFDETDKKLIDEVLKWGLIKYGQGTFYGGSRPIVFSVTEYNIYELLSSVKKLSNAVSVQNAASISSTVTNIMEFHKSNRSIDTDIIVRNCSEVMKKCENALRKTHL